MKSAVIVGCDGQDGRIAYDYLLKKNYNLIGIDIDITKSSGTTWKKKVRIDDTDSVFNLIKIIKPDEIYYFAAYHHSSEDRPPENVHLFDKSYKANVFSLINFLEAIKQYSAKSRLFYAASSLIFGKSAVNFQDENTSFNPDTIYGITKLDGLLSCRIYRNTYKIFASVGIFYNHESIYRDEKFITKKIIKGAISIKNNNQGRLVVGDLNAEVDWGYAPDYVDAAYRILNLQNPDDFIIATGKKCTVRDFVKFTFDHLGLEWEKYVVENKSLINKRGTKLIGNPKKLMHATDWKPSVNLKQMIKLLLNAEYETLGK